MTEADVLSVIMARIGTSCGVTTIADELRGVLLDISSRADFLTAADTVTTVEGTSLYDQPADLKRVYEVSYQDGGVLEKKTYRQILRYIQDYGSDYAGKPDMYALRHGKLYLWPVPDSVYMIDVDYSQYHPTVFTDILLSNEFAEGIYEGVIAALYRGQLFEKLRLAEKRITSRSSVIDSDVDLLDDDPAEYTQQENLDKQVDDDSDVLVYRFKLVFMLW